MRYPKYYMYLTGDEYRLTLDALIATIQRA